MFTLVDETLVIEGLHFYWYRIINSTIEKSGFQSTNIIRNDEDHILSLGCKCFWPFEHDFVSLLLVYATTGEVQLIRR